MSILSNIRDAIQDDGIDCFYPSQHVGKCTKEYVVVKTGGTVSETNVSSERPVYTLMCYVPANKYSRLESMIYDVKQSMKRFFLWCDMLEMRRQAFTMKILMVT